MDADTPNSTVLPQIPQRQIRHRDSLEYVLSCTRTFSEPAPRHVSEATTLYHHILADCEANNVVLRKPTGDSDPERDDMSYDILHDLSEGDNGVDDLPGGSTVPVHQFFRAIYDYCPGPEGRANVVRIALLSLFPAEDPNDGEQCSLRCIIPRARTWRSFTRDQKEQVYRTLTALAADFLEGFFVPLKAQSHCAPIVSRLITPTAWTEINLEQGTPRQVSDLRSLCLARDGHRCVVTRKYDRKYLNAYRNCTGRAALNIGIGTRVAHIIPHPLNPLSVNATDLHPSKQMVWRILNLFDPGISDTLSGTTMDTPMNAMIMASKLHDRFVNLQCYLQEAPGLNTYTFHTTRYASPLDPAFVPAATQIVFQNNERDGSPADLPSPRLLALHRACCLMLSISGATGYVENLLDDTETLMRKGVLAADGSSNFAFFLRMRGLHEMEDGVEIGPPVVVLAQ